MGGLSAVEDGAPGGNMRRVIGNLRFTGNRVVKCAPATSSQTRRRYSAP
jgi:hypothetical protein